MIEYEGDAALAPRVRSQKGGGAYVKQSSTLRVTDGSSISGNTATAVSSPAFALASGFVFGSPSDQPTLDRCEIEASQ